MCQKHQDLDSWLEQVHYDKYNRRYGGDGVHEPITWDSVNEEVAKFKEEVIHAEMVQKESEENSMFEWLKTLAYHTYDTILPGPRNRRSSTELTIFGKLHFCIGRCSGKRRKRKRMCQKMVEERKKKRQKRKKKRQERKKKRQEKKKKRKKKRIDLIF